MSKGLWRGSFVALGVLAAACGSSSDGGAPGGGGGTAKVLVNSSPATDPKCPAGATKLDYGADANGNGQLDPDEVTASQVVCNAGAAPTLTTVTPAGPDMKCKNGGVIVKSGADTNGNGKLDDAEVTQTDEICGGGTSTELSKTTPIAAGDVTCPFGGMKTSTGLDDGANGSVAGDGVLQDGEVTSTSVKCTTNAPFPGTFVPPGGPAGTDEIMLSGGAGLAGTGGPGGYFHLALPNATAGGNIAVWKTGKADADFTPATATPTYGKTKLEVAADTTLAKHAAATDAADGEYYVLGNTLFYRQDAGNTQIPVTGIHVAKGVTLTFPAGDVVLNNLAADIVNEGTITKTATNGNRGALRLFTAGLYIGGPGSKVVMNGAPVAGGDGGSGGDFVVSAHAVYSGTSVDTSGANGDPGGAFAGGHGGIAGFVALNGFDGPVESTGSVTTKGGSGKGAGGAAGIIAFLARMRGVRVKGALDASGGGGGAGGGPAALVELISQQLGEVRFSGKVTANGGDVDEMACAGTCAGGVAQNVLAQAGGGDIRWSGDVVAHGGKSKGTTGAGAAAFRLIAVDTNDPVTGTAVGAGSIELSGNVDRRGGGGANGGQAGQLDVDVFTNRPSGQQIQLFGYATVDTSGGTGTAGGAPGGPLVLDNGSGGPTVAGAVLCYADLFSKGGTATASGAGGGGGPITATSGNPGSAAGSSSAVVIAGAADDSGAAGVAGAGVGGPITFQARERVDLFGAVTSVGGATSGASAPAAPGGNVTLRGGTAVSIGAALSVNGGGATGATSAGAPAGVVDIGGGAVTAAADISANGGKGNGATGGPGGNVTIASSAAPSSLKAVTATGGTGAPNGPPGVVTIDGVVQP